MTWEIETAAESDLPRICQFFKSVYSENNDYGSTDQFHWKIFRNINQEGSFHFIEVDGAIVSTTSRTPKKIFINSAPKIASEIGDTYTLESFQRRGMFADLVNKTREVGQKKGVDFIYGTPNANSLPGYLKKTNFKVLEGLSLKSMSLPLGLPARFDGAPRFLRGMSEFLARFYAETRSSFFCGSKCWLSYTISNDIALAESSWGVFWDEIKTTHEVLFDRSFEAVRWRYKDSPNNYEMNFLWRNGRLVGYLVTRVMNHAGRSNLVVADCVCIQGEDVGIHVLARAVIQKALAARITRISAWFVETGDYYNAFLKMGFFDRDVIPVIGYADDFYQMVESRPRKWHFTIGDSDNI